jgi:hypothetical protein
MHNRNVGMFAVRSIRNCIRCQIHRLSDCVTCCKCIEFSERKRILEVLPHSERKNCMSDVLNEISTSFRMSQTEQQVRYGIGSAAAAAAIFAPVNYAWKGVLTGVAALGILSAVYGWLPFKSIGS